MITNSAQLRATIGGGGIRSNYVITPANEVRPKKVRITKITSARQQFIY